MKIDSWQNSLPSKIVTYIPRQLMSKIVYKDSLLTNLRSSFTGRFLVKFHLLIFHYVIKNFITLRTIIASTMHRFNMSCIITSRNKRRTIFETFFFC